MKMNYNVPLGSGMNPYEPKRNYFWGSVLGALIGGGFNLAGQAQQAYYTKEQQKLQSKLNKEEMATSQGLQNAQQENLMNSMYGKQVSGMKNAGLNPATANGTSPAIPSAGHPSTGGTGPSGPPVSSLGDSILSGVSTMLSLKSGMEDVKAKKLDNELKAIDVENAKAEQEENNTFRRYTDPDTGEEISSDEVDSWSNAHPGKLLNIEITKRKGGKGIRMADLFKSEFKSKQRDFRQSIDNADTLAVYNKLQRAINQGKLDDDTIMAALRNLPKAEYNQVMAAAEELSKRADLEELEGKELSATSIAVLMDKLQDKKMSNWDKFLATIAWTLGRFAKR